MTKFLLTLSSMKNIVAGTEHYSSQLAKIFPDLKVLSAQDLGFDSKFSPLKEPLIAQKLGKYLLENKSSLNPEIVFCNGMYSWNLPSQGFPIISIIHGTYSAFADAAVPKLGLEYLRTKYIYSLFEKLAAKNSSTIVSNSNFTKNNLQKYYGLDSNVIYNSVDTDSFKPLNKKVCREKLNLSQDKKLALVVARKTYAKGFDIIEKLLQKHKDIHFLCLFYPSESYLKDNLEIRPAVNHSDLPFYYSAADFVIASSRFEGFGYVPVEALSCNTPVISSSTGIASEIDLENLVRVKSLDVNSFSQAIDNLNKNLDNYSKFNSHKFIEEKFSFKLFSERYSNLIDNLS